MPAMALASASYTSPFSAQQRRPWTPNTPRATARRLQAGPSRRRLAGGARPLVAAAEAGTGAAATDAAPAAAPAWTTHSWLWRGHRIQYACAGCGPPVLLVHGFGASGRHWRNNIAVLAAAGYKVYALDLLGQGGSAKPALDYSIELWRDQITDFHAEFVQQPAVLVGNSIGSLASLAAAAAAPEAAAGIVLLNCAGGMNNKAISDDWRIKLAMPLFLLIDFLLQQRPIAQRLFDSFRSPDNIREVLKSVYGNAESVDDELVQLIYEPSCDEGALDAFVSIITGPPGPRPDHLLRDSIPEDKPLLVLWGDSDPFTPADGPVGRFFQALPDQRPNTRFAFLPGVGHCPHDDMPHLVHDELLPWLAGVHSQRCTA